MKALVLSGGSGSTIRAITHTSAKQLLPAVNKPVLFYGLKAIRDVGITDLDIAAEDTAPAIQEPSGDGSAFGLEAACTRRDAPGVPTSVLGRRQFDVGVADGGPTR